MMRPINKPMRPNLRRRFLDIEETLFNKIGDQYCEVFHYLYDGVSLLKLTKLGRAKTKKSPVG
ncbi:hypothetical protein MASR2M15_15300 [Anaerolineales bacterium]